MAARKPRRRARADAHANLLSPFLAGSAIYRLRPMFHLMLEHVADLRASRSTASETSRATLYTLSPGVAGRLERRRRVRSSPALAMPITWGGGEHGRRRVLYFSYELPFKNSIAVRTTAVSAP